MKKLAQSLAVLLALGTLAGSVHAQGHYKSFTVSTYIIQGTAQGLMNGSMDPAQSWSNLTRNLKIDKVYIEVMRNHTLVDEAGLEKLKKFYQEVPTGQPLAIAGSAGYLEIAVNAGHAAQAFSLNLGDVVEVM